MPEAGQTIFRIRRADWHRDQAVIAEIRRRVFIVEQGVPEAMEWETLDADCDWFVAESGAGVVGIVRLTPDGRLGRMAVLPGRRREGIGSALLRAALALARDLGWKRVDLHAQIAAMPFYERYGFAAQGPEFMEAGIAHRAMSLVFHPP